MKKTLISAIIIFLFTASSDAAVQKFYPKDKIDRVIQNTREYSGASYKFGGCDKSKIDCSCLMQKSFGKAGIDIPRVSREQANFHKGRDVTLDNLQKGDLVFFRTPDWPIGHVGLVVSVKSGRTRFIHSSSNNDGVQENNLEERKWKGMFVKGKRLFETLERKKSTTRGLTSLYLVGEYPQASERTLKRSDLEGLTQWDLRIMINEIFARHGYEFNRSPKVQAYFNRQNWYQSFPKISQNSGIIYSNYLSDTEKENIESIKDFRRKQREEKASYIPQEEKKEDISQQDYLPGKYPQASQRRLTENDMAGLSTKELRIMRNEIFARHGFVFNSSDMKAYFESQDWYTPGSMADNKLIYEHYCSATEQENIAQIRKYEARWFGKNRPVVARDRGKTQTNESSVPYSRPQTYLDPQLQEPFPGDASDRVPGKYLQASQRRLTRAELKKLTGLSKRELSIMRNEIFARHGFIFKTDTMKAYFGGQQWYQDIPKREDCCPLTTIESDNIKLIKEYE
ncbi:MAG: hypothetical protein B6245_07570 [Desulfobacteraceae bacterium 4572_88]|nr:MAG: hypothetical protein B6245_07570 [Desulfobacteraceae bacterium 4572_88]